MLKIEIESVQNGVGFVARIDYGNNSKAVIVQLTWNKLIESLSDVLKD